jgi:hypothetical protein
MNLLTLQKISRYKNLPIFTYTVDTEGKECDKQNVKWYEKKYKSNYHLIFMSGNLFTFILKDLKLINFSEAHQM